MRPQKCGPGEVPRGCVCVGGSSGPRTAPQASSRLSTRPHPLRGSPSAPLPMKRTFQSWSWVCLRPPPSAWCPGDPFVAACPPRAPRPGCRVRRGPARSQLQSHRELAGAPARPRHRRSDYRPRCPSLRTQTVTGGSPPLQNDHGRCGAASPREPDPALGGIPWRPWDRWCP